jgi:hypothetical protein
MGLLQKLETEICYSKEKVLAPLLLSPPSDSLSKQVIIAYLKSQKEIYQLMLESTKNLNRFEQELLPGILVRGCENLENLSSLLSDRNRLKYTSKESSQFEAKLAQVNNKILDALCERANTDSSIASLGQEISSPDGFMKMIMKDDSPNRRTPLYLDIMEAKNQKNSDPIADFKLSLEVKQIKAHQKKLNLTNPESGRKFQLSGKTGRTKPESDGEIALTLVPPSPMKTTDSRQLPGTVSSVCEDPATLSKQSDKDTTPRSMGSFSNLVVHKAGDKSLPDVESALKNTSNFLPMAHTFGCIDSPIVQPPKASTLVKINEKTVIPIVNKVALPVVLLLFSIKMKRLFFRQSKSDLAITVKNLEKALLEEKLKNEVLESVLSESKGPFYMRQNRSIGPVLCSSNLLGNDSGKLDSDLLVVKSRASLVRSSEQREGSQLSMPDALDEGSMRLESATKLKSKFDSFNKQTKLLGSLNFDIKPAMKFSIKELSDVLNTIQSEERQLVDEHSSAKDLLQNKPLYSDHKLGHLNARQTAIHYRNLAQSLNSNSSSLFLGQTELFRRSGQAKGLPQNSRSPIKYLVKDEFQDQTDRNTSKFKAKSLTAKKAKVSSFMTSVSKKK